MSHWKINVYSRENSITSENSNLAILGNPTSLLKRMNHPSASVICSPGPDLSSTCGMDRLEGTRVHATSTSTSTYVTVQTSSSVTHSVAVIDAATDPAHWTKEVYNSFQDRKLSFRLFWGVDVPWLVLVRELGGKQFDGILSLLNYIVQPCDSCHRLNLL